MTHLPNLPHNALAGLLAHGRDFGQSNDRENPRQSDKWSLRARDEQLLLSSGSLTVDVLAKSKSDLAKGDLRDLERRTQRRGLIASLGSDEAADWLDVPELGLSQLLGEGEVVAFVWEGSLRYPTWQFTDDPAVPVLPQLKPLVIAFGDDEHPTSILLFMTRAEVALPGVNLALTPVEWLTAGGDVQVVLETLENMRCTR